MCRFILKIVLISGEEVLAIDGSDENEEMVICPSKELIGDRV